MPETLTFHALVDPSDRLLLPWLDLYETAFPPNEKMLVSNFLYHLGRASRGEPTSARMLAATDRPPATAFIGLAFFDFDPQRNLALLWYLATIPQARSRGYGSLLYQEVVRQVRQAGCQALWFEVEKPEEAQSPAARALAERRIAFYQRQGARLLNGIHYLQVVGTHQPPTPMHLMVHAFQALEAEQAFDQASQVFHLTRRGALTLD